MTDTPDPTAETGLSAPSSGGRFRRAIIVSVLAHVAGLLVLLMLYLPSGSDVADSSTTETPASGGETRGGENSLTASENPALQAEQIQASIETQIDDYDQLPDSRKLSDLEKNLERLEGIATEASTQEVVSVIADAVGLDENAYAVKAEPGEGDFDMQTAQISDVTRSRSIDGEWQYESLLVDAEGRTKHVPFDGPQGETAYNAFEQMRKFPAAAGIYRSIVMPMLQKMIQAGEAIEKGKLEAERLEAQETRNREANR